MRLFFNELGTCLSVRCPDTVTRKAGPPLTQHIPYRLAPGLKSPMAAAAQISLAATCPLNATELPALAADPYNADIAPRLE